MKQETFTDMEYYCRKKRTKREELLEIMEEVIPWEEWVGIIAPYYPQGKRGRPPMGIEKMQRMYLLQISFHLSDPAMEDTIYDSYAMRKSTGMPMHCIPALTNYFPAAYRIPNSIGIVRPLCRTIPFLPRFPCGV